MKIVTSNLMYTENMHINSAIRCCSIKIISIRATLKIFLFAVYRPRIFRLGPCPRKRHYFKAKLFINRSKFSLLLKITIYHFDLKKMVIPGNYEVSTFTLAYHSFLIKCWCLTVIEGIVLQDAILSCLKRKLMSATWRDFASLNHV